MGNLVFKGGSTVILTFSPSSTPPWIRANMSFLVASWNHIILLYFLGGGGGGGGGGYYVLTSFVKEETLCLSVYVLFNSTIKVQLLP